MKFRRLLALATAGYMLLSPLVNAETPAATQEIIDSLQLRTGDKPMSDHSGWGPQQVTVTMLPGFSKLLPDYESQLQAAAGDVKLVFDRSGSFRLTKEVLADSDGAIGFCTPDAIKGADENLTWFHSYAVGMDRCTGLSDKQKERIVFTNSKRLSAPTIAEHTIAMLMSISRGLPAYSRAQADNRWDSDLRSEVRFGELNGKTMLVVGLGGIGTEIAWRAHGLGMRVIATRNSSRNGPDYVEYVGLADELHELAERADVIVNALPLTPSTRGLFNEAFFKTSKRGAVFLSVGRGRSTVTDDLVAALESGQLYGAGLDVTDPEPLPADSPLWQMDNVIITPHTSTAGIDSLRRMAAIAVENLRRYVAGEPMLNLVNIEAGY